MNGSKKHYINNEKATWWESSNWVKITSAALRVLSIFSWAFRIACVLSCRIKPHQNKKSSKSCTDDPNLQSVASTWVGRMAVSREERRWSKEPRMETTLSVMVWLLSRDSLILTALSLRERDSNPPTPTTILWSFVWFPVSYVYDVMRRRSCGGLTIILVIWCAIVSLHFDSFQ